jgi:DNA repair exonuclease SbcCD ATPase subunit
MSGFTDLRLNHRAATDEGFWPSFTDIMTVIVMIFLMGLVVVLIRHMELSSNLQSALEAEQRANALAQSTRDEKIIIDHKLTDTEEVLAQLRMQLLLAQDRRQATEKSLAVRDKSLAELQQTHESLISRQKKTKQDLAGKLSELTKLSRSYSSLQESQRTLSAEAENTRSQLEERSQALASLETQYSDLKEQKRLLSTDLESLRSTEQLSSEELAAARKIIATTDMELAGMRDEYSDLQIKYDKLVKPARTSKGKHVVIVYYSRKSGRYSYKIRDAGDPKTRPISLANLHNELNKLKGKYGKKLYIKLIYPEGSELSFNEAWKFSKEILNTYDYYNQGAEAP